MSLDRTSYAIIGVKIDAKSLCETYVVESCEHPERLNNTFCPVCGTRVQSHQRINNFEDKFGDALSEVDDFLYVPDDGYKEYAFFGFGLSVEDGDDDSAEIPDLGKLYNKIVNILSGIGVWGDDVALTFGLHVVSDVR